jgi:hypothetical protein
MYISEVYCDWGAYRTGGRGSYHKLRAFIGSVDALS